MIMASARRSSILRNRHSAMRNGRFRNILLLRVSVFSVVSFLPEKCRGHDDPLGGGVPLVRTVYRAGRRVPLLRGRLEQAARHPAAPLGGPVSRPGRPGVSLSHGPAQGGAADPDRRRYADDDDSAGVRVAGTVKNNPYIKRKGDAVEYLSFYLTDGSGDLQVSASAGMAQKLVQENRVPGKGDEVELTGTLNVSDEGKVRLRCQAVRPRGPSGSL